MLQISFLELYNEEIFDLLSPAEDLSKLRLYEDATKRGSVIIQVICHKNKKYIFNLIKNLNNIFNIPCFRD